MMQHVDEIVLVCAALCNMKMCYFKLKKIKPLIGDIVDNIFDGIFIETI